VPPAGEGIGVFVRLSATISDDQKYRYVLERQWSNLDPLVWIMFNPSTADALRDDPTIRRVIGFSMNSGYGSCVILNLFALRSTAKWAVCNRNVDPVGPENDRHIKQWAFRKSQKIVLAWGNVFNSMSWRPIEVLKILDGCSLQYLKLGKGGEPYHPLYLPSRLRPVPLEAFSLENLRDAYNFKWSG
jgi:hypothetical protein